MVSVGVGGIFNRSLYERSLRSKQIPMLRNHVPTTNRNVTAFQLMASPVVTIEAIVSVDYLRDILKEPFSTFPVLNSAGNLVGMMPKNFLLVLIKNHKWLDENKLNQSQKNRLPRMYRSTSSVLLEENPYL